jgi:hypothetical protein
VPEYCPERFELFWKNYPGGGSRLKAAAAWDKLKPDDALIDTMARALKTQMESPLWKQGIGIPHASTWLNQERWTDKLPVERAGPSPGRTTGPGPKPEDRHHADAEMRKSMDWMNEFLKQQNAGGAP